MKFLRRNKLVNCNIVKATDEFELHRKHLTERFKFVILNENLLMIEFKETNNQKHNDKIFLLKNTNTHVPYKPTISDFESGSLRIPVLHVCDISNVGIGKIFIDKMNNGLVLALDTVNMIITEMAEFKYWYSSTFGVFALLRETLYC